MRSGFLWVLDLQEFTELWFAPFGLDNFRQPHADGEVWVSAGMVEGTEPNNHSLRSKRPLT